MKKSLILLTVLLLAGTLAFAVDVTPEWTIDLSTYAIIGYDLNVEAGGIRNSNTTDFFFAYYPKATYSKGGEGLYGTIEAKDVYWGLVNGMWNAQGKVDPDTYVDAGADPDVFTPGVDTDYYSTFADDIKNSAGTITAKVVWNSLYFLISNGVDDMRFDYAANADGYSDVNFYGLAAMYAREGTLGIGYKSDMFSARVTVLSEGNEATKLATLQVDKTDPAAFTTPGKAHGDGITARTANTANDWAFALWLNVNPMAMLSVDAKAIFDGTKDYLGFGGLVTLKPIDLLSFTFGADYYSNTASVSEFDMKPALTVNLGDDTLTASLYYSTVDVLKTESEMDASLKFVEADADAGYVPGLGASVEVGLNNLAPLAPAKLDWSLTTKANYTIGAWKPYAEFKMSPNDANDAQMMKVNAGVTFSGIANTVITLDYVATDLGSKQAADGVHDDYQNDKGRITLKTKISF